MDGIPLEDPTMYKSIIIGLQYYTMTRSDIAYIINKVYQFFGASTDVHWQATKRVLRYLSGTASYGLLLQKSSTLDLMGFTVIDWARNVNDRKSIGTYCVFSRNSLLSWVSSKQKVILRSNTEIEYMALALVTFESIWLKSLLAGFGMPCE